MSWQELAGYLVMCTIGSIIASKYRTRENFQEWFEGLKLTRFEGVLLGVLLVATVMVLTWMAVPHNATYGR